jgi:hypothetical protein
MTHITLLFRPQSRETGTVVFSRLGYVLPLLLCCIAGWCICRTKRAWRGTGWVDESIIHESMSSFACANIPWATEIWLSLVGEVIYRATLEIRFRIAQGYNMVMKSWSHGVNITESNVSCCISLRCSWVSIRRSNLSNEIQGLPGHCNTKPWSRFFKVCI